MLCQGMHGMLALYQSLTLLSHPMQAALIDEDNEVREAAGAAFSIMFKGGAGGGAVDSVVPSMMEGE
jgi:hypothetical protein